MMKVIHSRITTMEMVTKAVNVLLSTTFTAVFICACTTSTENRYCRDDFCIVLPTGTSYQETLIQADEEEYSILFDESINSTIHFSSFEHFNEQQFETDEEEFRYLCSLTDKSPSGVVIDYSKIEKKEDRYLYQIKQTENENASGDKMIKLGGIYKKNNKYYSILVFIPEEKQTQYKSRIINMLKNAG